MALDPHVNFSGVEEALMMTSISVSCFLSIFGSTLILFSYLISEHDKSTVRKLLVCLSICDFGIGAGNLIGVFLFHAKDHIPHFHIGCIIQSFITTTSSVASFIWTMLIAFYVLHSLKFSTDATNELEPFFHVIAWGIPLTLSSIATGFNALGSDSYYGGIGWCWIATSDHIDWPRGQFSQLFWQIFAGKGIEVISYILTPALYFVSRATLKGEETTKLSLQEGTREAIQDADRKLILVPIVFISLRIWGTTRLFLNWAFPKLGVAEWFWLALIQGIGDSIQGFANCILFCIGNSKTRESLATFFRQRCCKRNM